MGSNRRSQVTAGREAHDTDILRIDVPLLGMPAHQLHGLLGIVGRNLTHTVWHAVFQNNESNALLVEERCPVVTFMLHGQMTVATSRTTHDGTSCSLFGLGQIDPHLCHIRGVVITGLRPFRPEVHLNRFLCRSQRRKKHHCNNKKILHIPF